MKKIIILLIILILTPIVLADTLNKGDTTYAGGRTVILVGISQNSVIVSVDGEKDIIALNDEKEINGLRIKLITLFYFDEDTGSAELEITNIGGDVVTKSVCGNEECEDDEDEDNCCEDCGCEYGYGCENKKCVKAECMEHKECYAEPKDFCSLDKCDPIMKKCTHRPIIECVVNDKCCPTACYYPADPDCPETKLDPNPPKEKPADKIPDEEIGDECEELEDCEKPPKVGFFKKIINWIKGLFD